MSSIQKPLKIVFMGTPDFAATILRKLHQWTHCEIAAVYSQPDRPAGRGKKLVSPPVKLVSQEFDIDVYQPLNFKNPQDIDDLRKLNPDILVVAAYGLILPQAVLDIPKIAPINIHASLLPLYRGAAPIQRAIMDGQLITGVSIMKMEASLDTGPVYSMQTMEIGQHNSQSLHDALANLGGDELINVLSKIKDNNFLAIAQDDSKATYAAKLLKHDGIVKWNQNALMVDAFIRGVTPWPGAQISILRNNMENFELRIMSGAIGQSKEYYAKILACDPLSFKAGQIWHLQKNTIGICTNDNFYLLQEVRPLNKGAMSAADFARGYLGGQLGLLATALT